MSDTRSADDILMGGGAPTCSFPEIGTMWRGQVLGKEAQQQRDITTGKPKFYDDGNPMMQVVITLQTEVRDPAIEGDDGERRLFVRGAMLAAIKKAVKDVGAKTVEVGGTLAVQYTHDGEKKPGLNPPKQFTAAYKAPVAAVAVDDLLG